MKRWVLILMLVAGLGGCRGDISDKPPIHIIRNMYKQPRYNPQDENPFFEDDRSQRPLVPGTVAREGLKLNPVFYEGKNPDGSWVLRNPRPITLDLLLRGQQRFNIYCAVCHDRAGTGQGLMVPPRYQSLGFPPPPSFQDDRIRLMPDGQVFSTISGGVRTMPSYRHQVTPADRWAVIAYLRALERSQRTTLQDVPADMLEKLEGR